MTAVTSPGGALSLSELDGLAELVAGLASDSTTDPTVWATFARARAIEANCDPSQLLVDALDGHAPVVSHGAVMSPEQVADQVGPATAAVARVVCALLLADAVQRSPHALPTEVRQAIVARREGYAALGSSPCAALAAARTVSLLARTVRDRAAQSQLLAAAG